MDYGYALGLRSYNSEMQWGGQGMGGWVDGLMYSVHQGQ